WFSVAYYHLILMDNSVQAQRRTAVAHQQVLDLLVVAQRQFVGFTTDARVFVPPKRGVRRIEVVAVSPDATGFDAAPHAPGTVNIQRPQPRTQPEFRIVGNAQRFRFIFKGGDANHRPENLLLETAHAIVAFNQRRLDV